MTLAESGLISWSLDRLSRSGRHDPAKLQTVAAAFSQAYAGRHDAFKEALVYARDYTGFAIARALEDLWPQDLTFSRVGTALLAADREMSGGRYSAVIRDNFVWREIPLPG